MKDLGAICDGNKIQEIYVTFELEPRCASFNSKDKIDAAYNGYCTAVIGNGLAEFKVIRQSGSTTS